MTKSDILGESDSMETTWNGPIHWIHHLPKIWMFDRFYESSWRWSNQIWSSRCEVTVHSSIHLLPRWWKQIKFDNPIQVSKSVQRLITYDSFSSNQDLSTGNTGSTTLDTAWLEMTGISQISWGDAGTKDLRKCARAAVVGSMPEMTDEDLSGCAGEAQTIG